MNTTEAVQALDAAAAKVVSFGVDNNYRYSGQFFLYAHDLGQQAVDLAQAQEREAHPGQPLVATAGMKPGTHVALIEARDLHDIHNPKNRTVWMSTHEAEKTTQAEFVANARGRVLIAGFGIGLVTDAVLAKPEVTEVVVVEKNEDVTNIMSPMLDQLEAAHGPRFKVVYSDIFRWKTDTKFDTIYFDIWPNITAKNLTGMFKLRKRFKRNLAPGGWLGCWAEAECRDMLVRMEANGNTNAGRVLKLVDEVFGQEGVVVNMCQINEGGE